MDTSTLRQQIAIEQPPGMLPAAEAWLTLHGPLSTDLFYSPLLMHACLGGSGGGGQCDANDHGKHEHKGWQQGNPHVAALLKTQ